jgi:hypothetical protein
MWLAKKCDVGLDLRTSAESDETRHVILAIAGGTVARTDPRSARMPPDTDGTERTFIAMPILERDTSGLEDTQRLWLCDGCRDLHVVIVVEGGRNTRVAMKDGGLGENDAVSCDMLSRQNED